MNSCGGGIRTPEPEGPHLQCGAVDHLATPQFVFVCGTVCIYYRPKENQYVKELFVQF